MNQCDGCNQNLPILDGIHYNNEKAWIGCTKAKYKESKGLKAIIEGVEILFKEDELSDYQWKEIVLLISKAYTLGHENGKKFHSTTEPDNLDIEAYKKYRQEMGDDY